MTDETKKATNNVAKVSTPLTGIDLIKSKLSIEAKPVFAQVAPDMNFLKEVGFALQALRSNEHLAKLPIESIITSVKNVALTGLTLNPVLQQAYLIPRLGKCCLDIGYKGMISLLVSYNIVKNIWATVVYEGEKFEIIEGIKPDIIHIRRQDYYGRKIVCCYAIAILNNDLVRFEYMDIEEINNIRNRSEAFKKGMGPWKTDYQQMVKKTVLRRLYGQLPKSKIPAQVVQSMELDIENNSIDFKEEAKSNANSTSIHFEDVQEAEEVDVALSIKEGPINPQKEENDTSQIELDLETPEF